MLNGPTIFDDIEFFLKSSPAKDSNRDTVGSANDNKMKVSILVLAKHTYYLILSSLSFIGSEINQQMEKKQRN